MAIKSKHILFAIMVLGVALHWNIWHLDIMGIHAWRQTQTMTVVENFAFEDMNILNPRINSRGAGDGIFRMEFPLMQWVFAWFYRWFGSELIIARMLTFIISMFGTFGFYKLLRAYGLSTFFSAIGAWCFAWSPVLFYYSVNPLPDNLALSLAVWAFVFLKRHQTDRSLRTLALFGLFLSLATAVKLPFILFGVGYIPVFVGQLRSKNASAAFKAAFMLLALVAPAAAWYAWVIPQWTNVALIGGVGAEAAFDYHAALNTIWGTFHALLPELLLNYGSVLFFLVGAVAFFSSAEKMKQFSVELIMLYFISLYYLYEVNMIGLAHDYYLFPFLPLLFIVVAAGAKKTLAHDSKWMRYLGTIAVFILPLTAYLRAEGRWTPMGNEAAVHANKDQLRNLVPNDALVVVGNDPSTHIFLYHINKKGWTFEQNWLTADQLSEHVAQGARFLYSNTELTENDQSIRQLLEAPIYDQDGITVYPVKQPTGSAIRAVTNPD